MMLNEITPELFAGCAFEELELPSRITSIGDQAFMVCTRLTSIDIPGRVTSIGENAFFNCVSLEEISLPDSLTYVAESAFDNCPSLTDLPDLSGLYGP